MSLGDARRFHELVDQVERLIEAAHVAAEAQKQALATLTLRINALQGQINALRARSQQQLNPVPPEVATDAIKEVAAKVAALDRGNDDAA